MPHPPVTSFEVFLLGDTGAVNRHSPDPVLEMLKAHLSPEQRSAVIFLGDNVYPRGLPDKLHLLRRDAEAVLKAHHAALKDYHGKVIFIGGNHDWNKGRDNGLEYILRQEKYLEELFGGKNVFLPSNGCPGPTEVNVTPNFTIVLINTQWWMQETQPIGDRDGCRAGSEDEFFNDLRAILEENKHRQILVCGHHPVYSYAIHGGRFKLKHHIFPFTIYKKNAYIPLPFIGSLLPLYRRLLGAKEDMSHPHYRGLRHKLKKLFAEYPGLIYAAGHEHNLQYIEKNRNHFIVSGAGSKLKYVLRSGKHLVFGKKSKGFFKLHFSPDGTADLSAWVIDETGKKGSLVYKKRL